jgi:hypothetical protein
MSTLEKVALDTKKRLLEDAHYRYDFDRRLYVNRKAKKAFSVQFIDDNDETELKDRISQPTDGIQWQFYFNNEPSESVRRQLEIALG